MIQKVSYNCCPQRPAFGRLRGFKGQRFAAMFESMVKTGKKTVANAKENMSAVANDGIKIHLGEDCRPYWGD